MDRRKGWERRGLPLIHAHFLGVRRQLVGDPASGVAILAIVGHEIVQPHSAVLADQAARDLPSSSDPIRYGRDLSRDEVVIECDVTELCGFHRC